MKKKSKTRRKRNSNSDENTIYYMKTIKSSHGELNK